MSARLKHEVNGQDCVDFARQGHPQMLEGFKEYGHHLALAVRSLAVVFAPEVVVLGGGFATAAPYFLPTAKADLPGMLVRYRKGFDLVPQLKVSKLEESIGVMGAAYMAAKIKKGR
jgi:glucokinase